MKGVLLYMPDLTEEKGVLTIHVPNLFHFIKCNAFPFISLFLTLLIIYGNSFYGDWHFDDYGNILDNPGIRLQALDWSGISKTMHGPLQRPVAYLSFAINYYFGGLNVVGYHIVNILIHYLASVFLFLFIYKTLKLPINERKYDGIAYDVALLASFLWAINPVFVTSVSYIVQRMASLTGLFYIMAMYFFLQGRMSESKCRSIIFYISCGLSALLAFGTKENAFMLPLAIYLYDLFLIQGLDRERLRRNLKILAVLVIAFLAVGLFFVDFMSLFHVYEYRPFTMSERMLTQPRIILLYISLLFYPILPRLTLLYDIEKSVGLFTPWTTAAAILIILLLGAYALFNARRKPLIAYCLIFFFMNHLIESSVLPLELIYEHRNYIPAMLLFILPAILIVQILRYFSYKRLIQIILALGVSFVLADQGHTTYLRNEVMNSNITLWQDNVEKSPNLSRPHANLGKYNFDFADYGAMFQNYSKALQLARYANLGEPGAYHKELGTYYIVIGDLNKATSELNTALKHPGDTSGTFDALSVVALQKGQYETAIKMSRLAVSKNHAKARYRHNYAMALLKSGNYQDALLQARKALEIDPGMDQPLIIFGEYYRVTKQYSASIGYWEEYLRKSPNNMNAHFALVELYHLTGNKDRRNRLIGNIIQINPKTNIPELVDELYNTRHSRAYVVRKEIMMPIVKEAMSEIVFTVEK
jgi:tetratricopeptide (TPR) repeat protein